MPKAARWPQLRAAAGFAGSLDQVRLPDGYYAAFVELHIEQGPLLEKEGLAVGIVTSIAAPAALRITVEGEGGHAGGVLMPDRKDAFCAAAEIVLAIEERALRDWLGGHLRHRGQVPDLSRGGEQYSQPGGDGSRYPRHRRAAQKPRAGAKSSRPARAWQPSERYR